MIVERGDPDARRTNLALLGTGVAAALPAFLVGGTPVRDQLAYVIVGYKIPEHNSWSFMPRTTWTSSGAPSRPTSTIPSIPIPRGAVLYVGLAVAAAAIVASRSVPSAAIPISG